MLSGCNKRPDLSLDPVSYYQQHAEQKFDVVDLSPWISQKLSAIHILDANGMSQTYSSKERLRNFAKLNPLSSQPYQQLLFQYKNPRGEPMGIIVRYYPSGTPMQLLTTFGGVARGIYCEWFENGQLRVKGTVVGGSPELNLGTREDYLFDGPCLAWNEEGAVIARIEYEGGKRHGNYITYHRGDQVWHRASYVNNNLEGSLCEYSPGGHLLVSESYQKGELDGASLRYYSNGSLQTSEEYEMGILIKGTYWGIDGSLAKPKVEQRQGVQVIFEQDLPMRLVQIQSGKAEGRVFEFNSFGELLAEYQLHQGLKEGTSIDYYVHEELTDRSKSQMARAMSGEFLDHLDFWEQRSKERFSWSNIRESLGSAPKVRLTWSSGLLRGLAQSWYENGQTQSQRELVDEKTHGSYTGYYHNGDLRMIEVYDHGVLVQGQYWKIGDTEVVSLVDNGSGVATFFDDYGYNKYEVRYTEGLPSLSVSSQN